MPRLPADLPDPEIRSNPRARRLRLKVTDEGQVQVVLPPGVSRARARAFVAERADWLRRALDQVARRENHRDTAIHGPFPTRLELAAADETWAVDYSSSAPGAPALETPADEHRLVVTGDDSSVCHRLLRDWLTGRARRHLLARVEMLARRHGFTVGRVGFRNQKTRWGSCSGRGNLSLNIRLMFLPSAVADYVIVHELCHLDHPHHGPAFWKAVEAIDPHWRSHETRLRQAGQALPAWICRVR